MSGSGRSTRPRRSSEQGSAPAVAKTGNGSGAGGVVGGGAVDPCALEFDLYLTGVNVAVARTVAVGAVATVRLTVINSFDIVICELSPGVVIGTLAAFPGLAQLIGCLRSGRRYVASVTSVTGVSIMVHVEPAP